MISDTFKRKNLKLISFISMVKERDPFCRTNVRKKNIQLFRKMKIFFSQNYN